MSGFPDLFYMNLIWNFSQLSSLALEFQIFSETEKTRSIGGGQFLPGIAHCPSVSPSAATAGCGWEGEGVRTPLVGMRTICAWD